MTIQTLTQEVVAFRNERDWQQFHTTRNLAAALSVEAGELLDHYLWDRGDDVNRNAVAEELADVFLYAFLLADALELDVAAICVDKLAKNNAKYPVDKAKGTARKYTDL